jgi:microcystin-dependent protein
VTDQFAAEIRIFPFNFAPQGWAMCNGQLLPINQNTALFSLLGTTYGGNGVTTFALPNLQGLVPLKFGQGSGLSAYALGQTGGVSSVVLAHGHLPGHSHALNAFTRANPAPHADPQARDSLTVSQGGAAYAPRGGPSATMDASQLAGAGGGAAHNNLMPSLTLNFCIALTGIFPARP